MRDAHYFRAQAELCLELAYQMSDQVTAENLRAQAARYHEQAAEIEAGQQETRAEPQETQQTPSAQQTHPEQG